MNDTQTIFQKNRELRNWWHNIIEDQKFKEVTLYVRSAFMEVEPTQEQLKGARIFEMLLHNLSEAQETGESIPGSGINHMAEIVPSKPAPK